MKFIGVDCTNITEYIFKKITIFLKIRNQYKKGLTKSLRKKVTGTPEVRGFKPTELNNQGKHKRVNLMPEISSIIEGTELEKSKEISSDS